MKRLLILLVLFGCRNPFPTPKYRPGDLVELKTGSKTVLSGYCWFHYGLNTWVYEAKNPDDIKNTTVMYTEFEIKRVIE